MQPSDLRRRAQRSGRTVRFNGGQSEAASPGVLSAIVWRLAQPVNPWKTNVSRAIEMCPVTVTGPARWWSLIGSP
jgi:hypothetical protein